MSRCTLCWKDGPPYIWSKATAPSIPKSKQELVAALGLGHQQNMTKPELKHHFKNEVRGKPHPSDPTRGLSSMNKGPLIQLLKDHGLQTTPDMTKGQMMSILRSHWEQQCNDASSGADAWDVVSASTTAAACQLPQVVAEEFCKARVSFDPAVKTLLDSCSSLPDLEPSELNRFREAYVRFVEASDRLLNQVSSYDG